MRALGLKGPENKLSESVGLASDGETVLADCDRVAQLSPPAEGQRPPPAGAMLAEAERKGWLPAEGASEPLPPRQPVAPLAAVLGELEGDRDER